jgi:hypothetical protein
LRANHFIFISSWQKRLDDHYVSHISSPPLISMLKTPASFRPPFRPPLSPSSAASSPSEEPSSSGHHPLSSNHLAFKSTSSARWRRCFCQPDSSSSHPNLPSTHRSSLGLQGMPLENQNGKCNWCVVSVFLMLMLYPTTHVHSADAAVNMTAAPSTRASSAFWWASNQRKHRKKGDRVSGIDWDMPFVFCAITNVVLSHAPPTPRRWCQPCSSSPSPHLSWYLLLELKEMQWRQQEGEQLYSKTYYLTLLWCSKRRQEQAKA